MVPCDVDAMPSRLLLSAESAEWLTRFTIDELLDEPGWQLLDDSDCDMFCGEPPLPPPPPPPLVLLLTGRESPIVPTFCAGV